jgi:precorrin-6Y C5,15-methyltransferase (decarboxylating)
MLQPVDIIGIGPDGAAGLKPEQVERILTADFLAGGERHLRQFPAARGQRFVIRDNLPELLEELGKRIFEQRCVVLASGDPLFYGAGTTLSVMLGPQKVRIEPALSSMQLAFARAGLSWQDAALASVHGRDLRSTLLPLLGKRRIGLFSRDGDSPAAVAAFFLQRELLDYEAIVGENLGTAEERVTHWPNLQPLVSQRFAPLNYLVLHRVRAPLSFAELERNRALVPGVPDEWFARPGTGPEVMTRQEIRSVLVGKLPPLVRPGETVWDIGAGLGTVAVEVAVLRPNVEVVAIERDPARVDYLRRNRERFDAYNVRIVEGTAPAVLDLEQADPRLAFVGGSGEHLPAIIEMLGQRLLPGGRLLANCVTLEHLNLLLQRLRDWHWPVEVTEVHVSRSDSLAGLTGLKPHRGVFVVSADKPEAASTLVP